MLRPDTEALRAFFMDPSIPAEDKVHLRGELESLDALYEANPLQRYDPHPKQEVFHASGDRVKAFMGGNRSGKTTAGIVDDLIQAVSEDCLPPHLLPFKRWQPPFHCRIVSPDFTSTMEGVIFEKLREWAPRGQLRDGSWDKAYDKQRRLLRFENGSVFSFMTFEQDLDKFGGWRGHRVHFDEEPPQSIRVECRRGLMDFAGDELFTMTPLHGMTYMFDEVYERRLQDGVTVVEVSTDENPHLDMGTVQEFFDSLSPEEVEARRHGRFVHFGGLVLGQWRDDTHLVPEILPAHLEGQDVYVGIDPGLARGGVVFVAVDRDNRMLVFDELYPSRDDINVIAERIREKLRFWRVPFDDVVFVIDPSGRNGMVTGADSAEDAFAREGIYCIRGRNARRPGIMELRRRLSAAPPALTVTRNCSNWLWERARWRVAEDEESSQDHRAKGDGTRDSFKTLGPDHLMDPTRYVAAERVWGPFEIDRPSTRRSMFEAWPPPRRKEAMPPTGALT